VEGALLVATIFAAALGNKVIMLEEVLLVISLPGAVRDASVNVHNEDVRHFTASMRSFILQSVVEVIDALAA